MTRLNVLAICTVLLAGAAWAHSGVQNAAVMARMHAMSQIAAEMKSLGAMAKGASAFDQAVSRASLESIAKHAAETPALFKAAEDDPKSEAKPLIWAQFDDFTTKAQKLEDLASDWSQSVVSSDDLAPALAALGATCKSCHSGYRE